jgi:hypothetical protein
MTYSINFRRFVALLALIMACTSLVHAQKSGEPRGRHGKKHTEHSETDMRPRIRLSGEIGLNATTLLDKVFRATADSVNLNPYLLTARLSYKNFGLHIGGGGDYRLTESFQTGFRDTDTRTRKSWDARVGFDYRTKLARRWSATFGIDAVSRYRLDKRITDSGFDIIEQISQFSGWGGGASIGIAYWFNAHLGLMTEANFYYISGTGETARRFKNFPELDDDLRNQNIDEIQKMLPSSIFLIYKF